MVEWRSWDAGSMLIDPDSGLTPLDLDFIFGAFWTQGRIWWHHHPKKRAFLIKLLAV